MEAEFWSTLQALARITNDDYVLIAVLDPNPVEYFYEQFGYVNWGTLPTDLTDDRYIAFLELNPQESMADSMLYNSNVVVWTSPSMKWGIFGERDYGTCILAFRNDFKLENSSSILESWKPVEEIMRLWFPLNFANQNIPEEFIDTLRDNYDS